MKSLYELINEQNGDLQRILAKYPVLTNDKGEGWLVLVQLKNPSDENKFSQEIRKGSSIFVAINYDELKKTNGEWGLLKLKPKINGYNQYESIKLNQSTIKKLKAEKMDIIDFKGSGFPHRGPVMFTNTVEYEAIYYKFDPTMLTSLTSQIDNNYYVSTDVSTIFGIVGLDRKIVWNPFDSFFK